MRIIWLWRGFLILNLKPADDDGKAEGEHFNKWNIVPLATANFSIKYV